MITITVQKNPFNHHDKEIRVCEHVPGKTAYEYVEPYIMGLDDFVVSISGTIVEDAKAQNVNSGDWIAVCPVVGKSKWLGIFASLLIGGLSSSLLGIKGVGGMNSFWTGVRSAAISMVGGALINHWFPPAKPDRPKVNPSYDWGNAQSLTGQGNALAVTYGTMRTAGQVLAQHVASNGENQYLNVLLCGGEGPIGSISDIRINDNPVSYYKDVTAEIQYGENDQSVIANFNDTYVDQALAYELADDHSWATQQTQGNAVEGLEITLQFPNGLYHVKDDGGLNNASVTAEAQYRKVGDGDDKWSNFTGSSWSVTQNPGGLLKMISVNSAAPTETWTITYVDSDHFTVSGSVSGVQPNAKSFKNYHNDLIAFNIRGVVFDAGTTFKVDVSPSINLKISAHKNTAFQQTYRVDNLSPAQYEVKVRCVSKSGTDTRYSTRIFWTQLSSIMYDDFARPGKVLVGIRALATNQLSGGMPSITWMQTRDNVWVWNPDTGQYEQKPATNPAWAAYDMIHRCRQIKNINTGNFEFIAQGAPASRAIYQDFANWAAFCDSRNLTFNYIYDTATDLWTALQKPEGVGRGQVIMRGTRFGCVCDAPGQPVQLFTVGNMITDQFRETFVGLKDRANAIEITFVNKDKGYQKDIITAYADDYDFATEPNITQITLDGATTVEQAHREGKYRLRLNQYLQRTVEHSADIDAIACQINDVVLLAHDVPQCGYSGRLLSATATTLQLDRQVTMEPGKFYAIAVQITNPAAETAQEAQSIVTVDVQGVVQQTCTDTVTIIGSLSKVPQKWDLYSFGETNKVVKSFRVLNISRDQDLRRKITCLEYIDEVYEEATDIPEINYSELERANEVSSVSVAEETYRQKDGTMVSNLNVAWSIPRDKLVRGYKILYSSDNGQTWTEWLNGITELSTSILGVNTQTTYLVKVCTVSNLGVVSTGVLSYPLYVSGKDVPPSDVASVSASLDAADLTKIKLSWTPVNDIDLAGYRIREGTTIIENLAQITTYTYTAVEDRLHSFTVTAVDNSGNESTIPATAIITPTVYPAPPTGFTAVQNGDCVYLYWNKNSATDIAGYEIRKGAIFNNGSLVQTGITGTDLSDPVSTETTYRYHIKAINKAGNYSEQAATAEVTVYALTPKNVILLFDEMATQSGIHTNTEFGTSYYTCLSFAGLCSDYPVTQCNQVGGSIVLKLQGGQASGEYLAARKNLGGLIKVNLAVDFISTALLSAGNSAALWFRHSRDGINFEEWKIFTTATLTTQYIDFKAVLESTDQTNSPIEVGTFTISADVDDVEKTGSAIIAAGGTTVDYGHTFLGGSGPDSTPIFTPTAIGAGLRAEVISAGLSSAVVTVVDAFFGDDAGGTITYRVKGYGG